jgi:hypothetical protein
MIAGLEAEHSWNNGAVVLNRQGAIWPRYDLSRVVGLGSLGERDDVREPSYGRRGEVPRPTVRRGKTVAYEGTIRARTLIELQLGRAALLDAFDNPDELQMNVLLPYQRTNRVPNPSPSGAVAPWGQASGRTAAAALALVADGTSPTGEAIESVGSGSAAFQGLDISLGVMEAGTYPVTVALRTITGATAKRIGVANLPFTTDLTVIANAVTPAGPYVVWTGEVTIVTPGTYYLYIRTDAVAASTFRVAAAAVGTDTYFDGDTPGARWAGLPNNSRSRFPGGDRYFKAGAMSADVPDEQFSRNWERKFTVVVRNSDGRVFYPELAGPVDTPAPVASAGTNLPLTPAYVIPTGGSKTTTPTFTNPGKAEADPILTVRGPVTNPLLIHDTQWRALRFPSLVVPAGQDLIVDFRDRTVRLNGVEMGGEIDHGLSDWWDDGVPGLVPGANIVSVVGTAQTASTNLGVTFFPADPA